LEQQGNEIKNLKQNILQLKSEHNICLKQKDDKISSLENALKNVINFYFLFKIHEEAPTAEMKLFENTIIVFVLIEIFLKI